jgi:1-deoxy-D-xylulose-5-phosphate reductoisomerase
VIRFDQIHVVNLEVMAGLPPATPTTLDDLLALDEESRRLARQTVQGLAR